MSNILLSFNDYIIDYNYENEVIRLRNENVELKAEIEVLKDIIKEKFVECAREKKILRNEIERLNNIIINFNIKK